MRPRSPAHGRPPLAPLWALALASLPLAVACRTSRAVLVSPPAPRVEPPPSAVERDAPTTPPPTTPPPPEAPVVRGLLAPPDVTSDRMECLGADGDAPGRRHVTPHDDAHPALRVRLAAGDAPVRVWARSEAAVGLLFVPDGQPEDGAFCVVSVGREVSQEFSAPRDPGASEAWRVYAFSPWGARAPFVVGTRAGPAAADAPPEPVAAPAPNEVWARLVFEPRRGAPCRTHEPADEVDALTCYAVHLALSGAVTRDVLLPDTVPLMGYVLGGWRAATTRRDGSFTVYRDGGGSRGISVDGTPGAIRVTDQFVSEAGCRGCNARRTTRVVIPAGLRVGPDPRGVIAPYTASE